MSRQSKSEDLISNSLISSDFHRPMEIEYLYTRPIAEAKKVGFEMPKLAMLEAELKFIEEKERR